MLIRALDAVSLRIQLRLQRMQLQVTPLNGQHQDRHPRAQQLPLLLKRRHLCRLACGLRLER